MPASICDVGDRLVKETALYCRGDGLGAPVDGETLEDRAKMPFYAIFADTQYVGDLRARKTIPRQAEDMELAARQVGSFGML